MKRYLSFIMVLSIFLLFGCKSEKTGTSATTTSHVHEYEETWSYDSNGHYHKSTCGHDDSTVQAHTFSEWKVTKEATHQECGIEERTCSVCGYSETKETEKVSHSFGDFAVYDEEYHVKRCECGEEIYQAHDFVLSGDATTATCLEDGVATYICSVCGLKIEKTTPALGHQLVYAFDETTHYQYCDRDTCDYKTDNVSHEFSDWSSTLDPTYTSTGTSVHSCICGYEEEKTTERLDYDFTVSTVDASIYNITLGEDNTWINTANAVVSKNEYQFKSYGSNGISYDFIWNFPRIDFTYYKSLSIDISGTTWNTGFKAGLSLSDLDDIDKTFNNEQFTGKLVAEYVNDKLYIYMTLKGQDYHVVIEDSEIISGEKGIQVFARSGLGDSYFNIQNFTVSTELAHIYVAEGKNCLGGFATNTCAICGDVKDSKEYTSFDFNDNAFGASNYNETSASEYDWGGGFTVSDDGTSIQYKTYENNYFIFRLPKVDYTKYCQITANVSTYLWGDSTCRGSQFAFDRTLLDSTSIHTFAVNTQPSGTFAAVYNDSKLTLTLILDGYMTRLTITDSDIINGNSSALLYVRASGGDSYITFKDFAASTAVSHDYQTTSQDAIYGEKVTQCTTCEDKTVEVINKTIDFGSDSAPAYGIWNYNITDSSDYNWGGGFTITSSSVKYKAYGPKTFKWSLPKINFNHVKKVSCNITMNIWTTGLILGFSEDDLKDASNTQMSQTNPTGTLTIEWKDGKLIATISLKSDEIGERSWTKEITDGNIIDGNNSLELYVYGGTSGDSYCLFDSWTIEE